MVSLARASTYILCGYSRSKAKRRKLSQCRNKSVCTVWDTYKLEDVHLFCATLPPTQTLIPYTDFIKDLILTIATCTLDMNIFFYI